MVEDFRHDHEVFSGNVEPLDCFSNNLLAVSIGVHVGLSIWSVTFYGFVALEVPLVRHMNIMDDGEGLHKNSHPTLLVKHDFFNKLRKQE